MNAVPRVAFFTDTFNEINGVALTSRQLVAFAHSRGYPVLCVRGADHTDQRCVGSTIHLELKRGPLAFGLDKGLRHDPLLWRMESRIARAVRDFQPDIIHVVSPGDVSQIGVYIARRRKLPLAISWHTNLHEFAAIRFDKLLSRLRLGPTVRERISPTVETQILNALVAFYRMGDVLYAPNDELVEMIRARTGKPVFLMKRGIDTELFNPAKRTVTDDTLRIGYVGRITPEKRVRFFQRLDAGLRAASGTEAVPRFRFLIVGDGSERDWLQDNLSAADLPGIQLGEDLARCYANMDLFAFPSRTDTFGNVVLEAFASGVPAIVTDAGGPKFIVRHGRTGFVAGSDEEFIAHTALLLRDAARRQEMAQAAREQALGESWDAVFEGVYRGYGVALENRAGIKPC
jgi:phosphatidylinositol alpha 1,6-mannosyltransferase